MIILKSSEEIKRMRGPNKIAAKALKNIVEIAHAGITSLELDNIAESYIVKMCAEPAFKGYRGYPNTLCVSINEQVVHGIPSIRKLENGDILSLDIGVYLDGYYGDAAVTIGIGAIDDKADRLIRCTRRALQKGIDAAVEGNRLSDISYAVQSYVEKDGYSVVRAFVGHGIGMSLHEEPQIPNYGDPGKGPLLKEGMVLAIEPMVNMYGSDVNILEDNWTVVTSDGGLSAHFEHTVAVTKRGAEILTVSEN